MNWVLNSESGDEYILRGEGELFIPTETTYSINRIPVLPESFTLYQNFPNPFNPVTTLRYDLPEQSFVNLTIYDMLGNEITELVNFSQDPGIKSVQWRGTDEKGNFVGAGVYLYKIVAGEFVQTKKMVLLK